MHEAVPKVYDFVDPVWWIVIMKDFLLEVIQNSSLTVKIYA